MNSAVDIVATSIQLRSFFSFSLTWVGALLLLENSCTPTFAGFPYYFYLGAGFQVDCIAPATRSCATAGSVLHGSGEGGMMKNWIAISLTAMLGACTVSQAATLEVPKERATECQSHCGKLDMELGAVVIISNSVGCVCTPRGSAASATEGGAAAIAGGAAIQAAIQQQQQQRQQQQQSTGFAPREME